MDLIRILCSILLPPLGVFMQVGLKKHFWINCLLTLLGYIPGIIHAIWVITKFEKVDLPGAGAVHRPHLGGHRRAA